MRIGKKIFGIILSLIMLLTIVPSDIYATNVPQGSNSRELQPHAYDSDIEGSIIVDLEQLGFPMAGAKFQIYQVAKVTNEEQLRFEKVGTFSGLEVDLYSLETAAEAQAAIDVFMENLPDTPIEEKEVIEGADGLVFTGLEHGVYLIVHSYQEGHGEVYPFMVHLPQMHEDNNAWNYDIKALPKGGIEPPEYSIKVTKKVTLDGKDLDISRSFYVTLFEDEELTRPVPNSTKELKLENSNTTFVEYTGLIENTTYYIAETNADGNVLGTDGYEVDFDIAIDNRAIELTPQNNSGEATITNNFDETPPEISTSASDKADGDKKIACASEVTIVDKVTYKNLKPGQEYLLEGVLMDKGTGKALLVKGEVVTAEKTFTAKEADGVEELEFTFDSSALAGQTLVVFEKLYHDGKEVAAHEDIDDIEQTVEVETPPTPTPTKPPKTPTPKTPTPKPPITVRTGDTTQILMYVAVAMASLGIGIYAVKRKKRRS